MYIGKFVDKWDSRYVETETSHKCYICGGDTKLIEVYGECPICSKKCQEVFDEMALNITYVKVK